KPSFAAALTRPGDVPGLSPRAIRAVEGFNELMAGLRADADAGLPVAEIAEAVLERSGYVAELEASSDLQDASRIENLNELVAVARGCDALRSQAAGPGAGGAGTGAGLAGGLPGAGGPGRRRRPSPRGRGPRRPGDADDPAHGQGPGVPGGVPDRDGGERLPAPAGGERPQGAAGGTPAGLRGDHPGRAAAGPHPGRGPGPVGPGRQPPAG